MTKTLLVMYVICAAGATFAMIWMMLMVGLILGLL